MKKALIVVDMQNDFVTGSLGSKNAEAIVPNVVAKCKAVDTKDTDIIFTKDTHGEDYLETREGKYLPIKHCIFDTWGWEIIKELDPFTVTDYGFTVVKYAFGSKDLVKDVVDYREYELVGLCTDICVISNALLLKAFYPERSVIVDGKCCAGTTPEAHYHALEVMKSCQVEIV